MAAGTVMRSAGTSRVQRNRGTQKTPIQMANEWSGNADVLALLRIEAERWGVCEDNSEERQRQAGHAAHVAGCPGGTRDAAKAIAGPQARQQRVVEHQPELEGHQADAGPPQDPGC